LLAELVAAVSWSLRVKSLRELELGCRNLGREGGGGIGKGGGVVWLLRAGMIVIIGGGLWCCW